MYTTRISTPIETAPEAEDIFSSALSTIFTDYVQNSHGVPGSTVTYHSPRVGDISLRIPTHPDVEEGRKLFAHYLWNSGVIAADAIECASASGTKEDGNEGEGVKGRWDKRYWSVTGKRTLELGAGTALPSIIAAHCGAASVTITDHPSSPALTMGAIEQNVQENVLKQRRPLPISEDTGQAQPTVPEVNVLGYSWGTTTMYQPTTYGKPSEKQLKAFDRIIIADCLWMPSQHTNLVKTILHYLDADPDACALIVAGFHTGRPIVRNFFGIATNDWEPDEETDEIMDDDDIQEVLGKLKAVEIFEIDVDGNRRPWQPRRAEETKDSARRWCVCAVLVKS